MWEFWDPAKQQLGHPWCGSLGTLQNNNWDICDAGVWGPCKTTIGTSMMREFWDPAKQQLGHPWCGSFGTLQNNNWDIHDAGVLGSCKTTIGSTMWEFWDPAKQKTKKLGHPWCKSFGILQDIYVGHKWCACFEILQNNSWDIHDVSYEILQDIPVGQMMCEFGDPATYQQRCALFGNLQDTSGTPMMWVLLRIWRKRGKKDRKKKKGHPWSKHFENLQDNKLDTNDAQVFESCKTTNRTCIRQVSPPLCSPLKSSTKCSSV